MSQASSITPLQVTVLSDVHIVDPAQNLDGVGDIVIEDGRISRIGPKAGTGIQGERVERIALNGHWALPGFVDLHVHFREPGFEYREDIASGLRASAAGGYTSVCAMPNTSPVNDNRAITEAMCQSARHANGVRFFPIGAITKKLEGKELTEMADLKEAGAIAVSDDGKCVTDSAVMRHAMEYAKTCDLMITQHAEDHALTCGAQMHEGRISTKLGLRGWPREAEEIIVARDIVLAQLTRARYHVAHVSSRTSLTWLEAAKDRGLAVSAEVTPHHLFFTDENVLGYNTYCKVNPPLRESEDLEALCEALAKGVIDCVATDHAPHATHEKDCPFDEANVGIVGLETALPLLLKLVRDQRLTRKRLAEVMAASPSKLAFGKAQSLRVGEPADIAIINPDMRWTVTQQSLQSKSHNTPLLNKELVGRVVRTLVGGKTVYSI